jgi:hypothetical protein
MAILRDGVSGIEIQSVPNIASLPATGADGQLYLVLDIDEFREWDGTTSSWVEPSSATSSSTHDLGGSTHTVDTIANLNSKVSDATLFGSAYGSTYVSSTTTTTVSQTPTFTKIAGTYTAGDLNGFTHLDGVLTYTGSLAKKFIVTASISATTTDDDVYYFRIAKDGTSIEASQMTRSVVSSGIGAIALSLVVELATNATIEVQTARAGVTGNLSNAEVTLNVCAVS